MDTEEVAFSYYNQFADDVNDGYGYFDCMEETLKVGYTSGSDSEFALPSGRKREADELFPETTKRQNVDSSSDLVDLLELENASMRATLAKVKDELVAFRKHYTSSMEKIRSLMQLRDNELTVANMVCYNPEPITLKPVVWYDRKDRALWVDTNSKPYKDMENTVNTDDSNPIRNDFDSLASSVEKLDTKFQKLLRAETDVRYQAMHVSYLRNKFKRRALAKFKQSLERLDLSREKRMAEMVKKIQRQKLSLLEQAVRKKNAEKEEDEMAHGIGRFLMERVAGLSKAYSKYPSGGVSVKRTGNYADFMFLDGSDEKEMFEDSYFCVERVGISRVFPDAHRPCNLSVLGGSLLMTKGGSHDETMNASGSLLQIAGVWNMLEPFCVLLTPLALFTESGIGNLAEEFKYWLSVGSFMFDKRKDVVPMRLPFPASMKKYFVDSMKKYVGFCQLHVEQVRLVGTNLGLRLRGCEFAETVLYLQNFEYLAEGLFEKRNYHAKKGKGKSTVKKRVDGLKDLKKATGLLKKMVKEWLKNVAKFWCLEVMDNLWNRVYERYVDLLKSFSIEYRDNRPCSRLFPCRWFSWWRYMHMPNGSVSRTVPVGLSPDWLDKVCFLLEDCLNLELYDEVLNNAPDGGMKSQLTKMRATAEKLLKEFEAFESALRPHLEAIREHTLEKLSMCGDLLPLIDAERKSFEALKRHGVENLSEMTCLWFLRLVASKGDKCNVIGRPAMYSGDVLSECMETLTLEKEDGSLDEADELRLVQKRYANCRWLGVNVYEKERLDETPKEHLDRLLRLYDSRAKELLDEIGLIPASEAYLLGRHRRKAYTLAMAMGDMRMENAQNFDSLGKGKGKEME